MKWPPVVIGTIFALLFALYMTAMARRKKVKQPTYEELKRERDALLFGICFAIFWVWIVAPRVDWSFLGVSWTGLFYSICLWAVYYVARWVLKRMDRSKSRTEGTSPEQR
jgi:hypothetical protein